ncbi:hypothetical protein [Streptomyces sp. t39]|uniref:hypothetical protein n=1 Tax=Streptomyces sp. t39 TaxID=1828156 RepID=UPI0011CD6C79|nr:hypothetical protein [Streptomyces sp. t39]TXS56591.1 hypothetical protein EAO77_11100 [Streptomyces sp. t39]
MTRPHRGLVPAALVLAGLALAGCGIRPTQIPVDAGPAPSRVPCEVSATEVVPQAGRTAVPVQVYLVCASQLVAVDRTVATPEDEAASSRVGEAQALVDELQQQPLPAEHEAGFVTWVRGPLLLSDARGNDPAGTLRLNRQPEDLPAEALAQLVCTLMESRAATDGAVLLGGPGDWAPRAYTCPASVKERPESLVPAPARPSSAG